MALQYSVELRNAIAAQLEAIAGIDAIIKMRTGAQPADCAAVDAGTVLATLNLPTDWMAVPANGVVAKLGTWEDASADAGGNAGHFRLYKADGVTCVLQGEVTATGGGGVMTVDNIVFAALQQFTVTAFSVTVGNA